MATATAATFVWLGMVVAISFLEAPLKFRARGVTVHIGLSIGRLVFRALNVAEILLAILVVGTVIPDHPALIVGLTSAAFAILLLQLAAVRPVLNRWCDRVLAGEQLPRSRAHHAYVVLELAKVVALVALGITTVSALL